MYSFIFCLLIKKERENTFIFMLLLYAHDFNIHKKVSFFYKRKVWIHRLFQKKKKNFHIFFKYWVNFEESKNQLVTFDII